jgi:hypothetical protein
MRRIDLRPGRYALGGCLVALALVAAGCGSSGAKPLTKAAYDKQMSVLGTDFGDDLARLGSATTTPEGVTAVRTLQTELGALDKKLAALTPPKAIKAEHAKLVTAITLFASELGPIETKVHAKGLPQLASIATLAGYKDVLADTQAIEKAGYVIDS